jgi:hypothetical protein
MPRLTAVLLSCAFLLTHSAAMADAEEDAWALQFCRGSMSDYAIAVCRHLEYAAGKPCTGSVEERLTCLDARVARQTREIVRLRYELDRLRTPRVHPLDERLLSQQ